MKYTTILAFVAGAFAIPQASITSAPAAAIPIPSGVSPQLSCALGCTPGDVTCQAACLGNARPNASQAIDTNKCAAKCDQGDGSAAAASAFARCVDGCINSLFPSSQTAFAPGVAAGSSVAAGATGSVNSMRPTGTASTVPSGSSSGSGAAPQSTGAADVNSARIAAAGLAGVFAIFVL